MCLEKGARRPPPGAALAVAPPGSVAAAAYASPVTVVLARAPSVPGRFNFRTRDTDSASDRPAATLSDQAAPLYRPAG